MQTEIKKQVVRRHLSYAGCLRVATYLSSIALLFTCWSLRKALAEAELSVQRIGDTLQAELGESLIGAPETIFINGQTLKVASRMTPLPVRDVLQRFEAHCSGATDPAAQLAQTGALSMPALASASSGPAPQDTKFFQQLLDTTMHLGVLRSERGSEGHLACFARGAARAGLGEIVKDLRVFAESGDFSRLGALRYVTVRTRGNGKTHVLVVWSDGPLRLGALFPKTGDAPGTDMAGVPRPAQSTRELCALAASHAYGLRLYRVPQDETAVLAFYDRALPREGWLPVPIPNAAGDLGDGLFARAFVRDGHALALGARASAQGGTGIALIDLGSVTHVSALRSASISP